VAHLGFFIFSEWQRWLPYYTRLIVVGVCAWCGVLFCCSDFHRCSCIL